MGEVTDPDPATAAVGVACAALDAVRDTEFWKIPDPDLLVLAQGLERVSRLVYAAQVHLTGEIDTRGIADKHGCTSTGALLRQALTISAGDARARVNTARAVLPRESPTGMDLDPVLPLLGAALADGVIGLEQTRIIVATMKGLPARVDPETRDLVQKTLVEAGITTEPAPFAEFARMIALTCDPDGTLDEPNPTDKVELTLGTRNPVTGLTRFTGRLDDYGVEVLGQATDGLAAPQPGVDGTPDPRSAATRRGQALVEALHRYLDVGDVPIQGGERPHITLTMDYADLQRAVGAATLEHGGPISAGQARMLACDARIIPAVLGTRSQVLDVGAAARLFPTAVRRAITLRDKGCVWPGCDRPAGWCDAHHVRFWADGGPTSRDNGVLLCRRHHSEIHTGHWQIRWATDGIPEFVPPTWVDPQQVPRRNTAHHIITRLRT